MVENSPDILLEMASVDGSKSLLASSDEGFKFECDPCEYEGNKREAKFFCFECNEYLCKTCKQHHQKLAASRKHQVVSGESLPERRAFPKQPHSENDTLCSCNDRKVVAVYCKRHCEVICEDCKILKHRVCESLSIEEACVEIVPSFNREHTLQLAKELKEKVAKLKQKRSKDIDNLLQQTGECRAKVKSFRKEIDELLDELEKKAISDIDAFETDEKKTMKQHLDTCFAALSKLEADCGLLESALTNEKQSIFIRNLKLTKTIDHVNEALMDMTKEVLEPNISFECDEILKCTCATSLGTVKTTEIMKNQPIIINLNVKTSTQVDVKHPSDKRDPYISGSVFMPNKGMVLCDTHNKVVKVLDEEFRLKEQINMQSAPWDISMMSDKEVVISQPEGKSLAFLKVFPFLQVVSFLDLCQTCWGVAVCDGYIYVSFDNGKVQIMARNDQKMENVYSKFQFKAPYHISVPKTGILLVSEHTENGTVYLLENCKELYRYTSPNLRFPLGMYVDGDLNVYVCVYNSHNVQVIDKNGKYMKTILSASDGLRNPRTISFRECDNTLVVGGQSKLLVFKLD